VLDLGCGDGDAAAHLIDDPRQVQGYGVEIDPESVLGRVKQRRQRDPDGPGTGPRRFEDQAFDHVIMSAVLQAMRNTEGILREMLRVGREAVVSFPNFRLLEATARRSSTAACRCPKTCPTSGTTRPTCASSPSPTSSAVRQDGHRSSASATFSTRAGQPVGRRGPNFLGSLAVYRLTAKALMPAWLRPC
jgi:methionine biosynthesis protein MetW